MLLMNDFDNLNLNDNLLKGIYLYGFTKPSSIQLKGITSINTGKDCIIQSQSGTGKTATYLLGVLNRIKDDTYCNGIIITPTRELANQVYSVATELSKMTTIKIARCMGGMDINVGELKKATVIIGTVGRIHHMIDKRIINTSRASFLVLDEADELLEKGLDVKLGEIIDKLNDNIQVVLISATMSNDVFKTSEKFMSNPIKILLKNNQVVTNLISQFYLDVETEDLKFETLLDLYNLISASQSIIFCNTIKKVEWLEQNLKENKFSITTIHSNMTQSQRDEIVQEFRDGKTRLLLTTDLLARGIDIPQVNMVVNYDLPPNKECYVHRIGRCGRFDKKGIAITMVKMTDASDVKMLNRMKQIYRINIKELPDNIEEYI